MHSSCRRVSPCWILEWCSWKFHFRLKEFSTEVFLSHSLSWGLSIIPRSLAVEDPASCKWKHLWFESRQCSLYVWSLKFVTFKEKQCVMMRFASEVKCWLLYFYWVRIKRKYFTRQIRTWTSFKISENMVREVQECWLPDVCSSEHSCERWIALLYHGFVVTLLIA